MSDPTPNPAPAPVSAAPDATKAQRIFTGVLWLGMISAIICVIGAKIILPHRDIPVLFNGGPYSLVDQNGTPFSDDNLRGGAPRTDEVDDPLGRLALEGHD